MKKSMSVKSQATVDLAEINKDNPCPKCGATDLGDVIPPEINVDGCYGPQGSRWRNHIGIEDPMVYDGVSWWLCKKCDHRWDRFKYPDNPAQEEGISG